MLNLNKKTMLFLFIILAINTGNTTFAEEITPNTEQINQHYEAGMTYLEEKNWDLAIIELTKTLSLNPDDIAARNNLAVCYTARAAKSYNRTVNLDKATNDYRYSLYYLKYYKNVENTATMQENSQIAEQNIKNILMAQNMSLFPKERLKNAKELRGRGEFIPAIIEYTEAAKQKEYAYESYVAIGDIMKVIDNNYQSAAFYDKALAINAKDPQLHLKFARALYKIDNTDDAVKEYNVASDYPATKVEALTELQQICKEKVDDEPNSAIAHMNLGSVYQKTGQLQAAMLEYQKAESLDPKNNDIILNKATLYQQQGDNLGALNAYNEILAQNPSNVLAHYYKAIALKKLGRTEEAITEYNAVLNLDKDNIKAKAELVDLIKTLPAPKNMDYLYVLAVNNPDDASIQYNFAYVLHSNKKNNDALIYYERTIKADYTYLDAYLNMATIYKEQNEIEKAQEQLRIAKKIFPDNKKIDAINNEIETDSVYTQLENANKLYEAKKYQEALAIYKTITKPTEEVYLGIGACYQAMEKYDDAIVNYNKAIVLNPKNGGSQYFLGLAYYYKKDYAKAEIALNKAKLLDPTNADVDEAIKALKLTKSEEKMDIGLALIDKKQYQNALLSLNEAIIICPQNGYAYYYRASIYETLKKYQLAIADYKKAASLSQDMTLAYYSMGVDYDMLNNPIEAKKMYQKFVTLSGNKTDEFIQYAKKRISEIK